MKKTHKYGAKKTEINGIVFPSKLEARCYSRLLLEQSAGEIKELQLQVPMPIEINGVKICKYIADFTFQRKINPTDWVYVVRDAKGVLTPEFKIKWKLVQVLYPLFTFEIWPEKK